MKQYHHLPFVTCFSIKRENQEIVFNKFYKPFDENLSSQQEVTHCGALSNLVASILKLNRDKQMICTRSKSNFKHLSSKVTVRKLLFLRKCFDNISAKTIPYDSNSRMKLFSVFLTFRIGSLKIIQLSPNAELERLSSHWKDY
uniref:Uncharacterized protein n=1 Tax=Glossina pallidipes TaxID=7398 RepID=A0A1A9Z636_GLOPL